MENSKQAVSDEILKQIAEALNVSTEVIENFSDQIIYNTGQQSGQYNKNHIKNPVKKIDKLYNDLLAEKDEQIEALEEVIKAKDEVIGVLKGKSITNYSITKNSTINSLRLCGGSNYELDNYQGCGVASK